ncbi:uncharacterized protein LOC110992530 isoform X2 [Pieris rapae]|uniref:uncharacterized protein LOC110992530 isoform X2 n=1 Tax=Pieris rapae TaxID=64459 RepID=UPI001E27F88A|nr:uncharacterized protein LOC110992530 isoform X2 [Pieris rapae]
MNAVIGLCHFCEAHGPRPLFCTFTTDEEQHTTESSKGPVECSGCTSLGPETVLVTKDDNGIIYCSRESVPNDDVTAFLQQAALRSITCEKISNELQQLAETVYDNEQSICSQRALRLKTGRHEFGQSRPLMQLTNENDIFKRLHTHFTWMLKTGALIYSETLYTSQQLLNKLQPDITRKSIFEDTCLVDTNEKMSIRELANVLAKDVFIKALYCLLTGIKIVISLENQKNSTAILEALKSLLPKGNIAIEISESSSQLNVCVLEEYQNIFHCKWNNLPFKYPTLMNNILNAMNNDKFHDAVLAQHLKSLQLEWLGIAKTIKSSILASGQKADAVKNLKKILGVSQHDEVLVNYWMVAFCE